MSKLLSVLISAALFASVSLSYSAVAVGEASVDGQAKKATIKKTKVATSKKKAKAKNEDEKTKVIQLDESNKGGTKTITVH